ncbi:MAG: potassium channel protein [Bacteroidales bacterium]|nr:potassium channel protein [Bacteroidales bacterium]
MNNMEVHGKRSALIALSLLFSGVVFGILGYMLIEDYTFSEAVYMTIITMGTVGFREVHPLSTTGMWFTVILIVLSLGIYAFAVSVISKYFIENIVSNIKFSTKVEKKISKLKNHVIVVGYGRNGSQAVEELLSHDIPVVVIDNRPKVIQYVLENEKILYVQGDATEDKVLSNAGVERARALITAMASDSDNLFVVITAREMNPNLTIISRASALTNDKKLKLAGATNVIMPDKVGGQKMAKLVVQPDIHEFIENIMLQRSGDVTLYEVTLVKNEKYKETWTIEGLKIREKTGANVIGLKKSNKQYILNPLPDIQLDSGDKLFVLGSREQLWHLKDLMSGNIIE